jgi:AcrR family transcriptional regulator
MTPLSLDTHVRPKYTALMTFVKIRTTAMSDEKRPYRMKARAESHERTRRRITESAVELHGTLGPSRTSMSAVAAHAGVRRSTLYRHFPDEAALFVACAEHWTAQHPLPDLDGWAGVVDPPQRLRRALRELYAFYDDAEPMLTNLLRDATLVETVRRQFAPIEGYMEQARATLLQGRRSPGRDTVAAVGHAVSFSTWRSLVREQGCTAEEAVEMMSRLAG